PWYFLWIQGALKLGDKTFWGVIFPGILLGFLMVVPYIDVGPSRRFADRRIALSVSFLMLTATVVTSYMGLPEFGVATAPDQEILNELTFEPAHNHMGLLRPVPFEQLAVGAYTTRQFAAEEVDARAAVEAFNVELEETGQLATLVQNLQSSHLNIRTVNFTPVPADAAELRHVMEEFEAFIASENIELLDGWGAVIITQNQQDVKRIDVIVNWQDIVLENGRPVLDENGQSMHVVVVASSAV